MKFNFFYNYFSITIIVKRGCYKLRCRTPQKFKKTLNNARKKLKKFNINSLNLSRKSNNIIWIPFKGKPIIERSKILDISGEFFIMFVFSIQRRKSENSCDWEFLGSLSSKISMKFKQDSVSPMKTNKTENRREIHTCSWSLHHLPDFQFSNL